MTRKERKRLRKNPPTKEDNALLWEVARYITRHVYTPIELIGVRFYCPKCKREYCVGFDGVEGYCVGCHYEKGCIKETQAAVVCKNCGNNKRRWQWIATLATTLTRSNATAENSNATSFPTPTPIGIIDVQPTNQRRKEWKRFVGIANISKKTMLPGSECCSAQNSSFGSIPTWNPSGIGFVPPFRIRKMKRKWNRYKFLNRLYERNVLLEFIIGKTTITEEVILFAKL